MIHDREDLLERYDSVNLNCEVLITSEAVYAKLLGERRKYQCRKCSGHGL